MSVPEPLTGASGPIGRGTLGATRRAAPIVLLAALPLVVVIAMFAVAIRSGPLALDFHNELYPEAKEILAATTRSRRAEQTSPAGRTTSGRRSRRSSSAL